MRNLTYIQSIFPFFDFDFLKQDLNKEVSLHTTHKERMKAFFSIEDFDSILNQHVFDKSDMQLYANGMQVQPEELTNLRGHIDRHKINNYVSSRGFSMKVNQVQRFNRNLAQMHAALTLATKRRVSMNLYYSPTRTPCFNTHQDPYPLFIIQVSGCKLWKYAPATREANLTHVDFTNIKSNVIHKEINEGDVLHLPAHVIHDAAAEKGASLHLTIGFMELNYSDLWSHIGNDPQMKMIMGRPMNYDGEIVDSVELKRTMQAVWRRYFEDQGMESLVERWALDEARKSISHHEPFYFNRHELSQQDIQSARWVLAEEKLWLISATPKGCILDTLSGIVNLPWSKETTERMQKNFDYSLLAQTGLAEQEIVKSLQQIYRMGLLNRAHG